MKNKTVINDTALAFAIKHHENLLVVERACSTSKLKIKVDIYDAFGLLLVKNFWILFSNRKQNLIDRLKLDSYDVSNNLILFLD